MADSQHPTNASLNQSGVPSPNSGRIHRVMPGKFVDDAVLPGTGDTVTEVIPIAGAALVRGRLKFTCAGTLSFTYRRPPPHVATSYATYQPPHADVVVVADTATGFDITPAGEALLAITFSASGAAGVVTHFDIMQL